MDNQPNQQGHITSALGTPEAQRIGSPTEDSTQYWRETLLLAPPDQPLGIVRIGDANQESEEPSLWRQLLNRLMGRVNRAGPHWDTGGM